MVDCNGCIQIKMRADPTKNFSLKFPSTVELIDQISHSSFLPSLIGQFQRRVKFYSKIFYGIGSIAT